MTENSVSNFESCAGSTKAYQDNYPHHGGQIISFPPTEGERIFAENAHELARYDFSVFPVDRDTRLPRVSGFNKWKPPQIRAGGRIIRGLQDRTLAKLARAYPTDNIAIHPLSSGVVFLDGDDSKAVRLIHDCAGVSPLRTDTRRGDHSCFEPASDLRPCNFRDFGIAADMKGLEGCDYVTAPPSLHHEDGSRYALSEGCEWSARYELPTLTNEMLDNLIEHGSGSHEKAERFQRENLKPGKRSTMCGPLSVGERALALNDRLCREVAHCDNFDALLDCAYTINEVCVVPLPEDEIIRVSSRVWEDYQSGKLEQWTSRSGRAQTTKQEVFDLASIGVMGVYGLALLDILKIDHMARVRRGKHFFLNAEGMARTQVIPGWDRNIYRRATKALLKAKAINFVGWGRPEGAKRAMKLYTFGPSVMG